MSRSALLPYQHVADAIGRLPDPPLTPGAPMAGAFIARGVYSFQAACRWVWELPYGCNASIDDVSILFTDGFGTCFTKHGVIAKLAKELDLPVYKQLGFYRLTDEIITGTNAALEPYGYPFIPQIHCFLDYQGLRVDLTEGNDHGKNKTIDTYDFIVTLDHEPTREEMGRIYTSHLEQYVRLEPKLATLTLPLVSTLLQACKSPAR